MGANEAKRACLQIGQMFMAVEADAVHVLPFICTRRVLSGRKIDD